MPRTRSTKIRERDYDVLRYYSLFRNSPEKVASYKGIQVNTAMRSIMDAVEDLLEPYLVDDTESKKEGERMVGTSCPISSLVGLSLSSIRSSRFLSTHRDALRKLVVLKEEEKTPTLPLTEATPPSRSEERETEGEPEPQEMSKKNPGTKSITIEVEGNRILLLTFPHLEGTFPNTYDLSQGAALLHNVEQVLRSYGLEGVHDKPWRYQIGEEAFFFDNDAQKLVRVRIQGVFYGKILSRTGTMEGFTQYLLQESIGGKFIPGKIEEHRVFRTREEFFKAVSPSEEST